VRQLPVALALDDEDQQVIGLIQDGVQVVELGRCGMSRREPGDHAAQTHLDLGEVLERRVADGGDRHRARALAEQEAVLLKASDGLPHRCRAHRQLRGETAFGDLLPGPQATRRDGVADGLVRAVGEGVAPQRRERAIGHRYSLTRP
jgi:hypothetical protein